MPETGTSPSPKIIGGFEILSKLGQGGMGAVFKARQVSMDRLVALKLLPPQFAKDERFVERFIREARASARLNHPHIVQGIEVGFDEKAKIHYFAMEFVDGQSVGQILKKEGKLEERRALEIVQQVATALVCASQAGIVHRDIKPDNIMLTAQGVAKLADLGLAKKMADDASLTQSLPAMGPAAGANLTQAGTTVGTPDYMSPEQAEGRTDMDVRTDLYSLGGTLYHMLVGKSPYSGGSGMETVMKHLTAPIPDPAKENPTVSRQAANVVMKLLQKDRAERYQTAQDLVEALDEVIAAHDGKTLKYATTGVRRPVTGAGLKKVGPRITTGPRRPVDGRPPALTRVGGKDGDSKGLVIAGVAGGAVLLLGLLFMMGGGSPDRRAEPKPKSSRTETPDLPQIKTPATPLVRPAPKVEKTEPAAKTAEVAPEQLPLDLLLVAARQGWTPLLEKYDAPAAYKSLLDFARDRGLYGTQTDLLKAALSEDFSGMARKLSGELDALVQSGDIAAVRKRIANLPEPDGPVDWAPLATFLNAKRVFANKLAELEAKVAAQPAQPAPLDDLLAKAEKHVLEGAAERARSVFADAARRPERQAQKDALLRHAEAFDWMTEVRAAWEDGAKKLADGRAFEFAYVKGGKPNLVGPAGTMKFAGVKDGRVHLIERGVTLTPAFDDLTHATRKNLLALYFEDHKDRRADLAAKNACLDLISFRAYADDRGPSLLLLQQDLESLRADGAPAEVLEVAGAWAEWRGRQLPEARFALDLGDGVTMEFLFVPAGVFTMGSPEGNLLPDGHPDADRLARERPAHKVTLSRPFYMGTYEVTQAQWQKIMGAKTFKFSNPDAPADSVSWKEARDFCDKLGRVHKLDARLPTEAQWEYACKAGAPTWFAPFDGGDAQTWRNLNEMALTPLAWFQGNQNGETQPVGQRKPNAWGFHDMYGNVVEWCEDRYGNYEAKDQLDPTGPAAGQFLVARGGHSKFGFERCRAEYRIQLSTSANSGGLGLRVVLPIGNLGEPVKK